MVQTRSSSEASNKNTTIKKKKRNTTSTAEDRDAQISKKSKAREEPERLILTKATDEDYAQLKFLSEYKEKNGIRRKGDKFIKEYAKKYHDDKAEKSRREMERVLMSVVYEDYSD